MIDDATYREWAKEFNQTGSYYEGSWDEGETIRFLGPDKHGQLRGLKAHIKENRPYEFISIEYDAEIVNSEEKQNDVWKGSLENYNF